MPSSGRVDVAAMLRRLVIACICLYHCSALAITCSVTRDNGRTTYTISDAPDDADASGCEYQWMNSSNYVLANNIGTGLGVEKTSIKDLVTSGCVDEIIYGRSCLSEEEAYSVTCKTSCRRPDPIQGDKETSYHWVWGVVGALVLLMVVGVVICCCKRRDEALRACSTGFMWTAVKQEPADVEEGKL